MINLMTATEKEIVKLAPELLELKKTVENSHEWHKNDSVYNHTMRVFKHMKINLGFPFVKNPALLVNYFKERVGVLDRKQNLLWATLFHDIAKPDTIKLVDGLTACPGHEDLGSQKARGLLDKVIMDKDELDRIVRIIKSHDVMSAALNPDEGDIEEKVIRAENKYGDIFPELLLHGLADTEGSQLSATQPEEFNFRVGHYHRLLNAWEHKL